MEVFLLAHSDFMMLEINNHIKKSQNKIKTNEKEIKQNWEPVKA